jgi:hypothetical protein
MLKGALVIVFSIRKFLNCDQNRSLDDITSLSCEYAVIQLLSHRIVAVSTHKYYTLSSDIFGQRASTYFRCLSKEFVWNQVSRHGCR